MDIDINQLRLLVVLHRERNLSKAAQKLYMSQSAASHVLAKLRKRFNNPLFIKTQSGMEPTPLALSLMPNIQKGLRAIDTAFDQMKPFDPQRDAKTFYISAIDYFEFFALPRLTQMLESNAPNIRIAIDILSENTQMERIEQGRIDLILGVDELQDMPRYYRRYPWLSDPYVGLVAQQSRFPEQFSLKTFVQTPQVHLPLINSGADPIDRWLLKQHQARQIATTIQSYAAGAKVIANTHYLMCVPLQIAQELATMLPVRIVQLPADLPNLSLSIFTHQLYDSQDSLQWLIKQIQKCAE
ncbi:LysR family transcriptional regulator [Agarivorans sp. QJM3NY_33]|uniref:LysR family transcriptional regulator n=1 Tax=Agarivorans sp. QJM3NY_33 TaxID=3421432 RepID=UPI003D7C5819